MVAVLISIYPKRHVYAIPSVLSCHSLRHDGILHLSILLELCHVKRYNYTVSYYLFWVVQELAQGVFDAFFIAQTSKCLGSLVSDHACLLCVTERFCKTGDGRWVRQLPKDKGDLVAEEGRWICESASERLYSRDGSGKVGRRGEIAQGEHGSIALEQWQGRV